MEKNRIVFSFALLYLSIVFPFLAFADSGEIMINNVYYRYYSYHKRFGGGNFIESRAWGARPFRSAGMIGGGSGYSVFYAVVVKGDYRGSVTIPKEIEINSQKYTVNNIESEAFKGSDVETVSIPYLNINNITFEGCARLRSVDIPNLTNLRDYTFFGCSSLREVNLPALTSIGNHAFSGCSSLTRFDIGKAVRTIGEQAFENCYNLQHISVETGNYNYDSRENCNAVIRKADNKLIVGCSNSKIASSVKSIGDFAFSGCSNLKTFDISQPIEEIGSYAFNNCSNLESITIANSVRLFGEYAFEGCNNLKKVESLNENPLPISSTCFNSKVEDSASLIVPFNKVEIYRNTEGWREFKEIGYSALYIENVYSIEISANGNGTVTFEDTDVRDGKEQIEKAYNAFDTNRVLSFKITPDKGYVLKVLFVNGENVTNKVQNGNYNYILQKKEGVTLSATFVKDTGVIYFSNTASKNVCIDNWDINGDGEFSREEAAMVTNISDVFKNIENIKTFDELQYFTSLTIIPDNCFYKTGLTSVTLPETITEIGDRAFEDCNLKTITIPSRVTKIGYRAFFDNWQQLTTVVSKIRMPFDIDKQTFSNLEGHTGSGAIFFTGETYFTNATLYVPAGTKERYQKAEGWNCFKSIEEIVSEEPSLILESLTIDGDKVVNTSQTVTATIKNYGANFDGVITLYYKHGSGEKAIWNNAIHTSIPSGSTVALKYGFMPASSGTYQLWVASNNDANDIIDYRITEEIFEPVKKVDFADQTVKRICIDNWDIDGDGELSETEAAVVNDIGDVFRGSDICAFDELKAFTGLITIPDFAFEDCANLVRLTLPLGINNIGKGAFWKCNNLINVRLNDGIKELGDGAFAECAELTDIRIPSSLVKMGQFVFEGCTSITEFGIPDGITEIPFAAFIRCEKLKSISLPNGVIKIEDYAFCDCSSLSSIQLPNSIKSLGLAAFAVCSSLKSIALPVSLERIGEQAFAGCNSLLSLTIPSNVKEMGLAIVGGCNNMISLKVADNNPYYRSTGNGIINRSTNMLEQSCSTTIISNDIEGIADYGFLFVEGVEEIELPENIKSIGYDSFQGCTDLKKVTLPKSLVSISDEAFIDCEKLEEVVVLNPVPVNIKDNVFYTDALYEETGNTSFTTAKLYVPYGCLQKYQSAPGWKNFSTIIEIEAESPIIAFSDTEVKRICVKNWDANGDRELSEAEAASVKSLGYAFGLSTIKTFDELRYFTGLTTIDEHAFDRCPNLQSVTIPSQVTRIGRAAFSACGALTTVNLPEGLTTIEEMSFERCSGLKSITLPSNVTNIGRAAFSVCSSLTTITLPEGLTSIPELCFERCSGLKSINIPTSVKSIGANAFYGCNSLEEIVSEIQEPFDVETSVFTNATYTTAKLMVPKGTPNKYRKAAGWNNFTKIVSVSDKPELDVRNFYFVQGGDPVVGTSRTIFITIRNDGNDFVGSIYLYVKADDESNGRDFKWDCSIPSGEEASTQIEVLFKTIGKNRLYVTTEPNGNMSDLFNPTTTRGISRNVTTAATLTALSYIRAYGDENPEFKFTADKGGYNGTPLISCNATADSPIGTYEVVITQGSVDNDFVTYVNGTLTITKAPLTIKAGTYTKKQGEENPEFTLTYEGFKNGETESVLTKKPTVTTSADWNSPVGVYDVFVTGAEAQNYEISYVSGTLTVVKRPKGDLDAKGYTDVTDVVAAINHVLGERTLNYDEKDMLDMNDDGELNVGDIILLVKAILEQGNVVNVPVMVRGETENMDLTKYTAMQLTVNVPIGARIKGIRLAGDNSSSHQLMYQQTDNEHYTVVVFSMSNQTFKPVNGSLLEIDMEGDGEPTTSNVLLATPAGERTFISSLPIGTVTGISIVGADQIAIGSVYDLRGNKVLDRGASMKRLPKGVYIMNGKKIIR